MARVNSQSNLWIRDAKNVCLKRAVVSGSSKEVGGGDFVAY